MAGHALPLYSWQVGSMHPTGMMTCGVKKCFMRNLHLSNCDEFELTSEQECIPVGCVLSAAVAVCWGGVCPGGVYLGVCVSQHAEVDSPPPGQNS